MHDLFTVTVWLTKGPNRYEASKTVSCIADRESAFDIYYRYKSLDFKYIEIKNCLTGIVINFEKGMWG